MAEQFEYLPQSMRLQRKVFSLNRDSPFQHGTSPVRLMKWHVLVEPIRSGFAATMDQSLSARTFSSGAWNTMLFTTRSNPESRFRIRTASRSTDGSERNVSMQSSLFPLPMLSKSCGVSLGFTTILDRSVRWGVYPPASGLPLCRMPILTRDPKLEVDLNKGDVQDEGRL